MALINCPECRNQISDKAENCPNCGYPLAKERELEITLQREKGCIVQTLNLGYLIILIVGLIFFISLIYNRSKKIDKNHLKNDSKNIIHNPKRN